MIVPFRIFLRRLFRAAALAALLCTLAVHALPQEQPQAPVSAPGPEAVAVFPHPSNARWWVSAQSNTIFQAHPDFHAAYGGPNSLRPQAEHATSYVETLYLGYRLYRGGEALLNVESAGGNGISQALGLAGFTNLDVVRNPTLGVAPYIARVQFHQIVPLSRQSVEAERDPFDLAPSLPVRRLEFRIGKMSTADFFDVNAVGSDDHLQFMNWTVDNNGAYDYAADTRGYTYGLIAEYDSPQWSVRFGEMLMPKVANGLDLQWNLRRARSENYELELRSASLKTLFGGHATVVRLLAYENHADMGDYEQAVARYQAGIDPRPIVENSRRQGRVKYGFGINLEQELPRDLRAFLRLGWNEGHHESFAYTEVNSTVAAGADLAGRCWHRRRDKIGLAVVTNGISAAHQAYLRAGGIGFLLGDNPLYPAAAPPGGALSYGRENILEAYYTLHAWRGLFFSADLQRIWNPGYNRARGPVLVPAARMHVDF